MVVIDGGFSTGAKGESLKSTQRVQDPLHKFGMIWQNRDRRVILKHQARLNFGTITRR
jgi:hypothetical protein